MVGCIERLAEPLLVEKYDIVVGDIQTVDESNHFIPNLLALKGRGKVCGLDVLQKYLTNAFPATVWNKLYNKKIIKDYHLMFKEKLIHEDLIWGFQFICFSKSIYLCDCVTYVCKGRSGSQTKTTNMKISAYSYAENVWEMGNFVRKENMEYNEYIHEIIQKFFSETIQKCIWNPKVFIYCYRYMRPSIKLSMKELIKVNRNHVRRYFRDSYFLLPSFIAPYYEYLLFTTFHGMKSIIRQMMHK